MRAIDKGLDPTWPAKARHLATARQAGLPVPDAWVWRTTDPPTRTQLRALIESLGGDVSLIARSALVGEDEAEHSAAGLGLTVGDLCDTDSVEAALQQLALARLDPQLAAYRHDLDATGDAVILQRFISHGVAVVAAVLRGLDYIEVHAQAAALAAGSTPRYAGQLTRWEHPSRRAVADVLHGVRTTFAHADFGLDVELVIDAHNRVHLVQVRPLTANILAEGAAFLAEAERAGETAHLGADLILDGEHNPEVLSVAHASLIDWIRERVPGSGRPRTVLGWLYTERLVRDLSGRPAAALSAADALHCLEHELLPEARRTMASIDERLVAASPSELVALLDEALGAVGHMLDGYLRVLVPARAASGPMQAARPDAPLSTRGRHAFLDVLPARWDIASPTLGSLHQFSASAPVPTPPLGNAEAAVLLTEWDDHLFAVGLAPLRLVYLRAAAALGLDQAQVFALRCDELREALAKGTIEPGLPIALDARRAQRDHWNRLRPPLRLDHGIALPWLPRTRLRGLPLGPPFVGPLAQRKSLEALLRDPPPKGAITVLPALTAQAALALCELGLQAVVCEYGGALSHAALMARELGLSALVGCRDCTTLPDGAEAEIDTRTGRLRLRSRLR